MNSLIRCLIAVSTLHLLASPPGVRAQTNLTLAVFISAITDGLNTGEFTSDLDGRPFKAAVDIAMEAINNHSGILDGYLLQPQYVDSQCSAGPSVRGFIEQVFDTSERIMIIGSDCSAATEAIAELAPFWNLAQISPLSTSLNLADTEIYRNFLRMVSSDAVVAEGVASLMERFNWTRVAVISQQETIFTSTFAALITILDPENITSQTSVREITFNTGDDPRSFVNSLYNSPTRIIFLNVYPAYAIEILCQAEFLGMTNRNGYQWFLYAWYPEEWWTSPPNGGASYTPFSCSQPEIESVIEHSIVIDHFPFVEEVDRNQNTAINMTRSEFDVLLSERLRDQYPEASTTLTSQAHFYFDAVLTAALALDVTKDQYDLSTFTYEPGDKVSMNISEHIFNTSRDRPFRGLSGEVMLDSVGDRIPNLRFFQYRRDVSTGKLTRVFIGNETYFESTSMIFGDGVPTDELNVTISLPLFIVYTIFSCIGIGLAVACALFTLVFSNRTVVKLSSPYVNLLIILGVILFYTDVILFGVDEGTAHTCTVNALCMTRIWIASIAFSLMYGTVLVKTWRVYYTFFSNNRRRRKGKKTVVQDWVLFVAVGIMVVIDLLLLVIVTAIPDTRLQLVNMEFISNPQSPGLPQIIGMCLATKSLLWIIILLIWKGLLLVTGLFLAFETRNIKNKHFNDSKLLGMSLAGIVILSLAAAVIGLLLQQFVDVFYALVGLIIILGNTALLCLLFIPKLYSLWKDPEGLRVFTTSSPRATTSIAGVETINNLVQEVEKLRGELDSLSSTQLLEESSFQNGSTLEIDPDATGKQSSTECVTNGYDKADGKNEKKVQFTNTEQAVSR